MNIEKAEVDRLQERLDDHRGQKSKCEDRKNEGAGGTGAGARYPIRNCFCHWPVSPSCQLDVLNYPNPL